MPKLLGFLLLCVLSPFALAASDGRLSISNDDVLGILEYVYYWHLDHVDVAALESGSSIDVLLSPMEIERDPGDNTEFVNLLVPALALEISLKQADYSVAEIGLGVRHESPKIVAIRRDIAPMKPEGKYETRSYGAKYLLAYFHERRHQAGPSEPGTLERFMKALEALVEQEADVASDSTQSFHVGPISKYSNDIWVYWAQQKKLLLFSSDMDIRSDAYWDHLPLFTRIFDLEGNVVTSLNEAPGRNAYVTKTWAARILYNTVIDGYLIRLLQTAH